MEYQKLSIPAGQSQSVIAETQITFSLITNWEKYKEAFESLEPALLAEGVDGPPRSRGIKYYKSGENFWEWAMARNGQIILTKMHDEAQVRSIVASAGRFYKTYWERLDVKEGS